MGSDFYETVSCYFCIFNWADVFLMILFVVVGASLFSNERER